MTSVALLPLLLLALCAASFLWSQDHDGQVVDSARSRFGRSGFGLSAGWRAVLTAAVLLLPVAAQIADLWGSTNQVQLSRVAYVLDRTGPSEAIFDPSQTVGVFRKRVDRSSIGSASFAVVSPHLLARDPSLGDTLRSGFQPTPYPGLWRGVLTWTSAAPVPASPIAG